MARINDVRQRLGGDPTVGQFLSELVDDLVMLHAQITAINVEVSLDPPDPLKTTKGITE